MKGRKNPRLGRLHIIDDKLIYNDTILAERFEIQHGSSKDYVFNVNSTKYEGQANATIDLALKMIPNGKTVNKDDIIIQFQDFII